MAPSPVVVEYLNQIKAPLRAGTTGEIGVDVRLSRERQTGLMNLVLRAGQPMSVEINYHWDVGSAAEAATVLTQQDYESLETEANGVAREILGIPSPTDEASR
jgi:hypothetical protein